jgi:hypothetical protein
MNEIDQLSTQLFEEAKRFLEKAIAEKGDSSARDAFAHAALLLGFSSLEAHLNAVAEELGMRPSLGVLDKSILTEREFALDEGRFQTTQRLKIYRLEDRLSYILANFSIAGTQPPTSTPWWSKLRTGMDLRNQLVHPKAKVQVDTASVAAALTAILDCLNALYQGVYARPFPPAKRSLQSVLTF